MVSKSLSPFWGCQKEFMVQNINYVRFTLRVIDADFTINDSLGDLDVVVRDVLAGSETCLGPKGREWKVRWWWWWVVMVVVVGGGGTLYPLPLVLNLPCPMPPPPPSTPTTTTTTNTNTNTTTGSTEMV